MKRIIVWFRGDLRAHDHPALHAACQDAAEVIPLFIFDPHFFDSSSERFGSNRNRFLHQSLQDLHRALEARGGRLVLRSGSPETVLPELAAELSASAVYYISAYTPYAIARDKTIARVLADMHVDFVGHNGALVVSSGMKLRTRTQELYKVFTPFWKAWLNLPRRTVLPPPTRLTVPSDVTSQPWPELTTLTRAADLSPHVIPGGETAARQHYASFLRRIVDSYHQGPADMANDHSSHMSAYLHFGCISPLELEQRLPDNKGGRAWNRQLAWREFYTYILLHYPNTLYQEFQERYRGLTWSNDSALLRAWQTGTTGYPAVDAGMRQLLREGYMHNRARLIVGSFFTKDLWCDWRTGEQYFMRMLVDGDTANNVGNWQWIASVGVDPAPVYRRLYNPTLQAKKFDPTGSYIRRYVPELQNVPDAYVFEPWAMPEAVQQASGCRIGVDYPAPIVDHASARAYALEHYKQYAS